MVFAAAFDAPVVFYCQNNQWAISEPVSKQSRVPLWERSTGYGFPGVRIDGNDVLACLAVTRWALEECRTGQRAGDDRGLHLPDGCAHHLRRPDPLSDGRRGGALEAARPDPAGQGAVVPAGAGRSGVLRLGGQSRPTSWPPGSGRTASALEKPPPERIFANVYTEPHAQLEAQQADYLAIWAPLPTVGPGPMTLPGTGLPTALAATTTTLAKALNAGLRSAMETIPRSS